MNNVRLLRPEGSDEEIPLQLYLFIKRRPFEFVLPSKHCATCENIWVVAHVHGGEELAHKVKYTITELVVTRRDEASLISVKGVAYVKCCATSIAIVG